MLTEAVRLFVEATGLFLVALFLSLVEIEIEGKNGWAEKIPTWYRTTGLAGRIWGLFMGGKPLTGYHMFLNCLLMVMFHLSFFQGAEWSLAVELGILAKFFCMAVFWDFLWFVFNPNYTVSQYKKENVWWFYKSYWLFGLFPVDYIGGLAVSLGAAYLNGMFGNGDSINAVKNQLALIGFLLAFTLVAIILSPIYGQWYWAMRCKDDRDKAGIFH